MTYQPSWDDLRRHPQYVQEMLAAAAVRTLGPTAADWARDLRATYPNANAEGLARVAVRRFTRPAAAASALLGVSVPLAAGAALAWARANLILHVAAAYGLDPTAGERVIDLLVLTRVHPDAAAAHAALAEARLGEAERPGPRRLGDAAGRFVLPAVAGAGRWVALRLAARALPGAAPLLGLSFGSIDTDQLVARTLAHYRRGGEVTAAS